MNSLVNQNRKTRINVSKVEQEQLAGTIIISSKFVYLILKGLTWFVDFWNTECRQGP